MAVSIYMKIDDIEGESTVDGYEKWSALQSLTFGGSQSGTMQIGTGGGGGKCSIQDLFGTKYVDKASSTMFQYMCSGQHFKKCEIHVTKAGGNDETMVPYVKYIAEEVIVSSMTQTPSDGTELVTESFSLNFAKITYIYTPQTADGASDTEIPKIFNIRNNKVE
ncbi:MAG: type VI secretion system tube protein Hcp [Gammaproteobacteria bacterium]|nr:type VI secretion system tube protein Hcp [Gammaproteobacteria bacterium]MCP5425489.1 type VI secretion system tube protein Hcp [Gammaproteobacteria bacterium]MCP5459391.1 type VI secretion system tube protein Hcp [Gammaproteobacteria bacterium]